MKDFDMLQHLAHNTSVLTTKHGHFPPWAGKCVSS